MSKSIKLLSLVFLLTVIPSCDGNSVVAPKQLDETLDNDKVSMLVVEPLAGNVVALSLSGRILLSRNWGQDWQIVSSPPGNVDCLALTSVGDIIAYRRSSRQVYILESNNHNWKHLGVPGELQQVIGCPGDRKRLVAIFSLSESDKAGSIGDLYESYDTGNSWSRADEPENLKTHKYRALRYSRDKPGTVVAFVASWTQSAFYSTSKHGFWEQKSLRSVDTYDRKHIGQREDMYYDNSPWAFSKLSQVISQQYGFDEQWRASVKVRGKE